jgi:rhomboid protease GluP
LKDIKIKIKEVYLPFLLAMVGTVALYNLFRWTFDIRLGILPLKDDLLNHWIPFLLPWVPVLIWLRRRIRILKVNGKRENGYFFYQFAMAVAIAFPIISSQSYLEKASYDLIEVGSAVDIRDHQGEKYFKIRAFDVDRKGCLPYATARPVGKYNEKLSLKLYYACPFKETGHVWYGIKFRESISNRTSEATKDAEYRRFLERSEEEFELFRFRNLKYFEKVAYSDDRDGFLAALEVLNLGSGAPEQIFLRPMNDDFEARLGDGFFWIFASFGIGALILLGMVIIPRIDEEELQGMKMGAAMKDDDLKPLLEFINPRGPNKVTAILLLVNLAVFVVVVISGLNMVSPTAAELLEIGGFRRPEVLEGEYWRLLTAMFIHAGIAHLFMNMVALLLGAGLLEELLGGARLMVAYLLCGVMGSLASIYWHENTVSCGASGAIMGLFGIILAFLIFRIFPEPMRKMAWGLFGLFAGLGLLLGLLGGIDNAAHLGGLASGFVIGVMIILLERKRLISNAA